MKLIWDAEKNGKFNIFFLIFLLITNFQVFWSKIHKLDLQVIRWNRQPLHFYTERGGGGVSTGNKDGYVRPEIATLAVFQIKYIIFYTPFQTWLPKFFFF